MPMPVGHCIYVLKSQIHAVWSSIVVGVTSDKLGRYNVVILQIIWRPKIAEDSKLPFCKLFICNTQLALYPGSYVC